MSTLTRFTNNVVRAKAVKQLRVKKGGKIGDKPGSKFTNEVHRESGPKLSNTGQVAAGGKSHTIGGKGGNSYGGAVNRDNQVIRGI